MPLPRAESVGVYGRKGVELALRQIAQAPEQRSARKLAAGHGAAETDPEGSGAGKKVLILTPRDWAAHVQYEGVIAQALRLRGASVEFLTCGGGLEVCDRANTYESPPMPCRTCTRYVEKSVDAHGFPRSAIRDGWERNDPLPWPELDEISRADLGTVTAEGQPLGALIEIPLKWFLCSADIDEDPLAGQMGRAFLRSARRIVHGVTAALDRLEPDVVLLCNGLFLFESIAWSLCRQRGIDVVTYERAFLKETLVFHRGAPAGLYDLSDEWARADRPLTESEERQITEYLDQRRHGKAFDQFWQFRQEGVAAHSGRMATLFTNLTWDTAVIGRDRAFPDIRAWIAAAIEAFARRPDDRLVIRVHPSELRLPGKITRDSLGDYIREHWPVLPANVILVGSEDLQSSYELMDASDVGLVYSSTAGLEMALSGRPVIVAGETHYRGKGFTVDVTSPEDFRGALDRILDDPAAMRPDVDQARRYAHFFFFRAPIRAPFVVEPLPGLARITTEKLTDLAPGHHADLDRICTGILEGASFVDEASGPDEVEVWPAVGGDN
ncbi:MAG: hypothetical protein QOI99_2402 [Actinomycetota bacterium]|nr:hypothetical protein [Actinomycetota bacterium]